MDSLKDKPIAQPFFFRDSYRPAPEDLLAAKLFGKRTTETKRISDMRHVRLTYAELNGVKYILEMEEY